MGRCSTSAPATCPRPARPATTSAAPSTRALVRRFVKWYGGRAQLPTATWCLIDPLPSALTGVSFAGAWTRRSRSAGPARHRAHRVEGGDPDVARAAVHGDAGVGRQSWSRPSALQWQDDAGLDERDALLPGQAGQPLRRRPGCGRRPDVALDAALQRAGRRDAVGDPGQTRLSPGRIAGTAYQPAERCGRLVACSTAASLSTSATASANGRRADLSFPREVFSFPRRPDHDPTKGAGP